MAARSRPGGSELRLAAEAERWRLAAEAERWILGARLAPDAERSKWTEAERFSKCSDSSCAAWRVRSACARPW